MAQLLASTQKEKIQNHLKVGFTLGLILVHLRQAASGNEEPLITHADHYTTNRAYGVAAYSKGEVLMNQLGAIMGDSLST